MKRNNNNNNNNNNKIKLNRKNVREKDADEVRRNGVNWMLTRLRLKASKRLLRSEDVLYPFSLSLSLSYSPSVLFFSFYKRRHLNSPIRVSELSFTRGFVVLRSERLTFYIFPTRSHPWVSYTSHGLLFFLLVFYLFRSALQGRDREWTWEVVVSRAFSISITGFLLRLGDKGDGEMRQVKKNNYSVRGTMRSLICSWSSFILVLYVPDSRDNYRNKDETNYVEMHCWNFAVITNAMSGRFC